MDKAARLKRQSYICDMEYKLILALKFPVYPLGENTPYYHTMTKYIELFYDEFDVISDMRPYFELFG